MDVFEENVKSSRISFEEHVKESARVTALTQKLLRLTSFEEKVINGDHVPLSDGYIICFQPGLVVISLLVVVGHCAPGAACTSKYI